MASSSQRPRLTAMQTARHRLRVDFAEQNAALLDLARACVDFDVQLDRLRVGDYSIDDRVIVERKTYADFATSLIDGRLFPQAAALARCPHRPVILLEGPTPPCLPDVHPHALKGAVISLAVMWRLPVLYARDPAGNEATTPLDHRPFPKPFARSRIQIDDRFLGRVVPSIATTTPDMQLPTTPATLLDSFLRINGELRRRNNQTIAEQAAKTAVPRPPHPAYPAISLAVQTAFTNILDGADPQEELTQAAEDIDEDIEDNDGYPPFGGN